MYHEIQVRMVHDMYSWQIFAAMNLHVILVSNKLVRICASGVYLLVNLYYVEIFVACLVKMQSRGKSKSSVTIVRPNFLNSEHVNALAQFRMLHYF